MLSLLDRPDSQALEVFLGALLVWLGIGIQPDGFDPFAWMWSALIVQVGAMQVVVPMTATGKIREGMLGASMTIFFMLHAWVAVVGTTWCWYKNQLDRKCAS